jgi:hypothetical protein
MDNSLPAALVVIFLCDLFYNAVSTLNGTMDNELEKAWKEVAMTYPSICLE